MGTHYLEFKKRDMCQDLVSKVGQARLCLGGVYMCVYMWRVVRAANVWIGYLQSEGSCHS